MGLVEEDRTILYHVPHPAGIERRLGLTLLRVGKGKAKPNYVRSMASKDVYTVQLITEGRGGIRTDAGQTVISKGDAVVFRKGKSYTWWTHPKELLSHYWIDLDGPLAMTVFETAPADENVLRRSEAPPREIECFERLLSLYESPAPHNVWGAMALFFELWHSLERSWAEQRPPAPLTDAGSHLLAQRARAFIDEHFTEELRLRDISNSVAVTPEYLSVLFRREYGLSPYEYVIQCRLDAATNLLRKGASVKEAALSVGYLDPGYFSRLYRRKRGISPGRLAKHLKKVP